MERIETELCRLLTDCLKKDGQGVEPSRLSDISPEKWRLLLELADRQRMMPLLWHRLRQKGLDDWVPRMVAEELREALRRNTLHNLSLYGELRQLLSAVSSEGIPLILLKGIVLAEAVYDNIGLREMNDIDVLVRPADITRISEILSGIGFVPLQPIDESITLKALKHLPPMVKNGQAAFEVHWNLTSPGVNYSIDPGCLWENAVPVQIAGCSTLTLSPDELLLHLCLHTSYQHQFAFGLRPSCDIAETIARFGQTLDWQAIVTQAVRRGWQRGVYLALRLAGELAGAEVPGDVLKSLRPEDLSEALLETARAQVFSRKSTAAPISAPFAELLQCRGFRGKLRIFWQRVFLPKTLIAALYSVPADSAKIYCCYPRRLVDVLRRHGHTLKKYRQNDIPLKDLVERTNLIAGWLSKPAVSCCSSGGAEPRCSPARLRH